MGVFWSHGINCDKKVIKKLIDNENWFHATLIEYSAICNIKSNGWNNSLPRAAKQRASGSIGSNKITFSKNKKCFGRITVCDDCIIFQGVNCHTLLNVIIAQQDKSSQSPQSPDTVFEESPDHLSYKRNICYSNSSASTTSGGVDNETTDRLHTFVWPIETVRHFGFKDNFFSFDSGRFSSTGEGRFTFKIKKIILFLSIFQSAKERLYHSKPSHRSPMSQISPDYYNLAIPESYQNSRSSLAMDTDRIKTVSKSSEFFFNKRIPLSPPNERKNPKSQTPLNYCHIDFSDSYVNIPSFPQSLPSTRRRSISNSKISNGQTLHYLTICENQTIAVEKVLKRIG